MAAFLTIIATAILSSVCTLLAAYLFFKMRIQPQLEPLQKELGEQVQQRVKAGVLEAGHELLPDIKEKVAEGFSDAISEKLSGPEFIRGAADAVEDAADTVEDVAKTLARTGANIVGDLLAKR